MTPASVFTAARPSSAPEAAATMVVRTRGDFAVVVPASLDVMTSYVLLEQEDWFEDELRFVRRAIGTGQRALDIGANYGVYALSLARAVGPTGRVYAFEPSSPTRALLRESAKHNGFAQLQIVASALSDRSGTAILQGARPELLSLADPDRRDAEGERVALNTLDGWAARSAPGAVDFIKIDAEGHEEMIVAGGRGFFAAQNPLVMLEVRSGPVVDLSAVVELEALGYAAFGLVPEPGVLVPLKRLMLDDDGVFDAYLLNVFMAKPARQAELEARGLLLADWAPIDAPPADTWPAFVAAHPVYAPFPRGTTHREGDLYLRALGHYAASVAPGADALTALRHLDAARHWLGLATAEVLTPARLSTIVRICAAFGWRRYAALALRQIDQLLHAGNIALDEPFLAPLARYDDLPAGNVGAWFSSSIIEARSRLNELSSCFATRESVEWLDYLRGTGFLTPELERRRQLMRLLARTQTGAELSPLLAHASGENLNPELWTPDGARLWAQRQR
jgi:FkbM family methyltransferase